MRLIISTISENDAPRVARCLVEERLVACVNIVPAVRSIYSWQGKIEDDSEALMLMKTTAETVGQLTGRLRELHPYDVPEIISVTLNSDEGNPDYLDWVKGVVGADF